MALHVAAKAARDSLFLTHVGVHALPQAMVGAALLSIVVAVGCVPALRRRGPARVLPTLFAGQALVLAGAALLLPVLPSVAGWGLYLAISALGALTVSAFWLLITERFDPHAARKAMGSVGAGAALGGFVGGSASIAAGLFSVPPVWVLGALATLGALGAAFAARRFRPVGPVAVTAAVGGARAQAERVGLSGWSAPTPGVETVTPRASRTYVRNLALIVLLLATVAGLLDFLLKAAADSVVEPAQWMSFFAGYHTVVGLLTFFVQATGTRSLLGRTRSLRVALGSLPILGAIAGTALLVVASPLAAILARGGYAVAANSVFRSGYELLYAPLAPRAKRAQKPLIDVAMERAGDALAGLLLCGLMYVWPRDAKLTAALIAGLVLTLSLLGAATIRRLERGYKSALLIALREHAGRVADVDAEAASPNVPRREDLELALSSLEDGRPSVRGTAREFLSLQPAELMREVDALHP